MFGRKTVEGRAQVLEVSEDAGGHRFGLKVDVAGRDTYFIDHTETMPPGKAVMLGNSVPVIVSAKHPRRLSIVWSDVPDRARAAARDDS